MIALKKLPDAISAAVAIEKKNKQNHFQCFDYKLICHKSTDRMGNTAVPEQSDLDL